MPKNNSLCLNPEEQESYGKGNKYESNESTQESMGTFVEAERKVRNVHTQTYEGHFCGNREKDIKLSKKMNKMEEKKKRQEEYYDLKLKIYLLDAKKNRLKKEFYEIVMK